MRHFLCGIAAATMLASAHAGDYVLEVDGRKIELDLDKPASASIGSDKPVTLVLRQKTEQTWRDDDMSFVYPATLKPVRMEVEKDISQTLMATPSGSLIIVQRYIGLDTTNLIDMMVSQLTDEDVSAGYKRTTQSTTRKLTDGMTLAGKKVHTEHPGESWDHEVLAIGDRKGGYLIVSAIHDDSPPADHEMIEKFWHSLQLRASPAAK